MCHMLYWGYHENSIIYIRSGLGSSSGPSRREWYAVHILLHLGMLLTRTRLMSKLYSWIDNREECTFYSWMININQIHNVCHSMSLYDIVHYIICNIYINAQMVWYSAFNYTYVIFSAVCHPINHKIRNNIAGTLFNYASILSLHTVCGLYAHMYIQVVFWNLPVGNVHFG